MSGMLEPELELNKITIEPVPQKKGMIMGHVEYTVKAEKTCSEVIRRYSDFQALQDLLIYRFPYRIIPLLPPAKLRAKLVGVSSDFIEERRKALVRWLTIITSHPSLAEDLMIRYFLTDSVGADLSTSIRDLWRHVPDEFILSDVGLRAQDVVSTRHVDNRGQVGNLEELLRRFSVLTERLLKRSVEESQDLSELGRELSGLGNQGLAGSGQNKETFLFASKEVSSLGSKMGDITKRQEVEVHQKVLLLLDVVTAYAEMTTRQEKNVAKDNKVGAEKLAMIKAGEKRGVLATNTNLATLVEEKIKDEIVLTDLASRQAFSWICREDETRLTLRFASLLPNLLLSLSSIQVEGASQVERAWRAVNTNLNK